MGNRAKKGYGRYRRVASMGNTGISRGRGNKGKSPSFSSRAALLGPADMLPQSFDREEQHLVYLHQQNPEVNSDLLKPRINY